MTRKVIKREVSRDEFAAFVAAHPELTHRGSAYVESIRIHRAGVPAFVWHKPVAYILEDKCFVLEDA